MISRQTNAGIEKLPRSLTLVLMSLLSVLGIYLALAVGELIGNTTAFLYLRNDLGIPITLLRVCVLTVTVLPVAFVSARALMRWSPDFGLIAILGVAFSFTLIILLFQVFVYELDVWSSSLLKVVFAIAGLVLAAYRFSPRESESS